MSGTLARCTVMTATPESGSLLTAETPVSCEFIEDDELIEKLFSDDRTPSHFAGKRVAGMTLITSDRAFAEALKKGTYVTGASASIAAADYGDGTATDAGAVLVGTIVTLGIVTNSVKIASSAGEPVQFSITIMLSRKGSTKGTFTVV